MIFTDFRRNHQKKTICFDNFFYGKIKFFFVGKKWLPFFKRFKLDLLNSPYKNLLKKKFNEVNLINPYSIKNNYKILSDSFKKKQNQNIASPEIFRDEDWLNWRLMECPFKKNIYFFEYRENFAIVHIVTTGYIKRLNILYTFYLNDSDEENLFRSIFKWALYNSIDL